MAFRFQRRIQILPGVRLNLSKGGASLSLGPRGASVTLGRRGIWGNVGVPGTGLSWRQRLDAAGGNAGTVSDVEDDPLHRRFMDRDSDFIPEPSEHELNERYVAGLRELLRDREVGNIDWHARGVIGERPPEDDEGAFEDYVRAVAHARFARRMLAADTAAWNEVLAEELRNENLPFAFAFDFGVDEETRTISLEIELPPEDIVPHRASRPLKNGGIRYRQLPIGTVRRLYEDVCCSLMLRFIHEVYRTIPEADVVEAKGFRTGRDQSTGRTAREVLLACVTDRESFTRLDLDHVDSSSAMAYLGGASRVSRGLLRPIEILPDPELELLT